MSRVIGFLDMDAFEVQIYIQQVYPKYKKYYPSRALILADGKRIISVNPVGKSFGITRFHTVPEAREICSNVKVMWKEASFNKPESKRLRHSSWKVLDTILEFRRKTQFKTPIEFSPSDEFYFDLSEDVDVKLRRHCPFEFDVRNSHAFVEGDRQYSMREFKCKKLSREEIRFYMGMTMMDEIRQLVKSNTGFEGSVGVAENKLLAKLACSLHKPIGTTMLTRQGFNRISPFTSIEKIRGLGGDFGHQLLNDLNFGQPMTIESVRKHSKRELKRRLTISKEEVNDLFCKLNGICSEDVTEKLKTNAITVSKTNYRNPRLFINQKHLVAEALSDLCLEMSERIKEDIERHKRWAKVLQVHIWVNDDECSRGSFEITLNYQKNPFSLIAQDLFDDAFYEFKERFRGWRGPIGGIKLFVKPKEIIYEPKVSYTYLQYYH